MKYFIVLDVGGSSIKHALMNEKGDSIHSFDLVTTPLDDIHEFVNAIVTIITTYKDYGHPVEGIAMSMPCPVNPKTGATAGTGAVACLGQGNAKSMIEEQTGLPVIMENDANCAGLAEGFLGNAKDDNNYVVLVLGSGIGGTVIINKQLLHGKNLHAGEFGCMLMDRLFDKPLGQTFSESASVYYLSKSLADAKNLPLDEMNGKKVFELYDQGDADAIEQVQQFYRYLAVGIFNIQYSIDPDKILIGGAISERADLMSGINAELAEMKGQHHILDISVEPCKFKGEANLIGALYNFIQKTT